MSVINQMLRDLDARGQGDGRRREALAAVGIADASPRPRRAWNVLRWTLIGLTAAVGVAAVLWQSARLRQLELPSAPPSTTPSTATVVEAATREIEAAPALPASTPTNPPVAAPPEVSTEAPAALPEAPRPEASSPEAPRPAPSPVATTRPPAARSPPVASNPTIAPMRASIERVDPAPDADRLQDARTALAEGDAEGALRRLATLGDATAEAKALEAAALQQLGRHAEAEQAYRSALRREPDIGAWWAGLGISLDAMGRGADALAAFREAQSRGPLDPALADYLGERIETLSAGEPSR